MPSTSAPYEYPTPAMIADYRMRTAALRGGTETQPDTSSMTAPYVAGPTGLRQRIGAGLARAGLYILGADAGRVLFPPQQPLQPVAQARDFAAVGRAWDYQTGWNTRVTPRSGMRIGFPFLKALSQYDIISIMIERVKDEVVTQAWKIGPVDKKKKRDSRCDQLEEFFSYPDKLNTWADWTKQLLDQVLIYDAPAIWLQPDRGGRFYGLKIIDGSMITPKIMGDGSLPPPEYGPAYQQVIHGLPAVDYIQPVPKGQPVPTDPSTGEPMPELLYKPRSPRVDIPYGYSACEQIIRTIEIGMKREEFLLDFYTAGSMPDMMVTTPDTWNVDQVAQFQANFDSLLKGNLINRRGVLFLPGGKTAPYEPKKEALTDATDEWIIRICCFAMGLSPMPFTKMMNRASGQQHAEQQKEEGTLPYLAYLARLFNHIILLKFGWRDLVFRWEEEVETDPLEEAQRIKLYTDSKVLHPDEARQQLGMDAMPDEMRAQMDMPTFAATVTATVLPPDQQAEADDRAKERAALAPPGPGATGPKPGGANGAKPAPGVAGKALGKGRLAKLANRSALSGRQY